MSDEIIKKAKNAENMILSLIESFKKNNVDSSELEKVISMIKSIKDEETMLQVLIEVEKTIKSSTETISKGNKLIKKETSKHEESVDKYTDEKEGENLLKTI